MTVKRNPEKRPILNILHKEWKVTFSSLNTALFITLLPILIICQALLYIYLVLRFAGAELLIETFLGKAMQEWLMIFPPDNSSYSINEKFIIFFLGQFPFYILLIPTMISVSFATFSIIEEKQTRTLEPLLATPVKTWELLFGKTLASTIPSILMCWFCTLIIFIVIKIFGLGYLTNSVLNFQWYISLFILVPLISLLTFMLGVIGSSRASDAKSAQNLVVLVVLPVLGIIALQLSGIFFFNLLKITVLIIAMIVTNIIVLRIAIKLFDRESIIIRWK